MISIRRMRGEDAEAIRRVDAAAFGAWWKRSSGTATELPRRTLLNVVSSREKDPEGCFVAQVDDQVVGAIFSRTWGSIGWFGALAVQPEYQGRGIGKELILAGLEYLRKDRERLIGLETMPENPYNLGLYLRLRFEPRFLTLFLERALQAPGADRTHLPAGFRLCPWSLADLATQQRWLAELQESTGRIYPCLDYSKEILGTARHGLGDTMVLTAGSRAVGLSTVWLTSVREGWNPELASLQVMALDPRFTREGTFRALLEASEVLALSRGKQRLMVPVNAGHTWALAQVLHHGYQVQRAMVRMVLPGSNPSAVTDGYGNLSRWSG